MAEVTMGFNVAWVDVGHTCDVMGASQVTRFYKMVIIIMVMVNMITVVKAIMIIMAIAMAMGKHFSVDKSTLDQLRLMRALECVSFLSV